jgi:hypothetical protein
VDFERRGSLDRHLPSAISVGRAYATLDEEKNFVVKVPLVNFCVATYDGISYLKRSQP